MSKVFIVLNVRDDTESKYPSLVFLSIVQYYLSMAVYGRRLCTHFCTLSMQNTFIRNRECHVLLTSLFDGWKENHIAPILRSILHLFDCKCIW